MGSSGQEEQKLGDVGSQLQVLLKDIVIRDYELQERNHILVGFDVDMLNLLKANRNSFERICSLLYETDVDRSFLKKKIKVEKPVECADDILNKRPGFMKKNDPSEQSKVTNYMENRLDSAYLPASVEAVNNIIDWKELGIERSGVSMTESERTDVNKRVYAAAGISYEDDKTPHHGENKGGKTGQDDRYETGPEDSATNISFKDATDLYRSHVSGPVRVGILLNDVKIILRASEREGRLGDDGYKMLRRMEEHLTENVSLEKTLDPSDSYWNAVQKLPSYF